jgi:hypothetical protein
MLEINIHCVFGDSDATHVEQVLVPSLISSSSCKVNLRFLNYTPGSNKEITVPENEKVSASTLLTKLGEGKGFAENHNLLFRTFNPSGAFILINPDCIATENLIDVLVNAYERDQKTIGIVEASQWPFEHPKEFDANTGETPWASGACVLVSSKCYEEIGGMDERYFLYAEDVDMSWSAWLSGYKVIHEQNAKVMHFTNAPHEGSNQWSLEYLYGLRNHVLLLDKFFGEAGRRKALRHVKSQAQPDVYQWVQEALEDIGPLPGSPFLESDVRKNPNIKVFGKGLYHKMGKS